MGEITIEKGGICLKLGKAIEKGFYKLIFYDMTGHKVLDRDIENFGEQGFVPLQGIRSGRYIITLNNEDGKTLKTMPLALG